MPGSSYYKIGKQVPDWLSVVEECCINSSTKSISESLNDIELENDEVLISFDVSSLYTNVPVREAINHCAELLFSGKYPKPPVSKEVFIELARISNCNVLMLIHDGYYLQIDGLAMGSPPAPHIANGWLSKFDENVQGDAKIYSRYMDDILRDIKEYRIDEKLREINDYHPNLTFTIDKEKGASLSFLDLKISCKGQKLTSTWYAKAADTGLTMNYHALAPLRYKRSVVYEFIFRIFYACSNWMDFDESLGKAKRILDNNQYPSAFYEPIIEKKLSRIIENKAKNDDEEEDQEKKMFFVQYRGRVTDKSESALRHIKAAVKFIATISKTKACLPSLKQSIDKSLKSGVVYKISCPRCLSCYVGQTSRHLITRMKEHNGKLKPVRRHFESCECEFTMDDVEIIKSSSKSMYHLMALEALLIRSIKPNINKRDEYKRITLSLKKYNFITAPSGNFMIWVSFSQFFSVH